MKQRDMIWPVTLTFTFFILPETSKHLLVNLNPHSGHWLQQSLIICEKYINEWDLRFLWWSMKTAVFWAATTSCTPKMEATGSSEMQATKQQNIISWNMKIYNIHANLVTSVWPSGHVGVVVEPSVELFLVPLQFAELPVPSVELPLSLLSVACMLESAEQKITSRMKCKALKWTIYIFSSVCSNLLKL